jgi:hypothetical protein
MGGGRRDICFYLHERRRFETISLPITSTDKFEYLFAKIKSKNAVRQFYYMSAHMSADRLNSPITNSNICNNDNNKSNNAVRYFYVKYDVEAEGERR